MEPTPDMFASFGAVFTVLAVLIVLLVVAVVMWRDKGNDDPIDKEL